MNSQQKTETVAELQETLSKVASIIVTDFRGLTVEEANQLRREIRKADCQYRVVKNTLFGLVIRDRNGKWTPAYREARSVIGFPPGY